MERFVAPGFKLGHWTDQHNRTGCTVLLADRLSPAAVDIRGGSPGTRETDLLGAGRAVQRVDAILLTGGSAFGLAAADGVVQWLFERGRGYPTAVAPVPIVAGAVIYDLSGTPPAWPTRVDGYSAVSAAEDEWTGGPVGGGASTSVSKLLGRSSATRTGIGIAQISTAAGVVSAVFVNNAFGDVFDVNTGKYLTTPADGARSTEELLLSSTSNDSEHAPNTVIGAITVGRSLNHDALTRMAVAGHAGIARTIRPAHTPVDGDTVFAIARDEGDCSASDLMILTAAAQVAVSQALVAATRSEPAARKPR